MAYKTITVKKRGGGTRKQKVKVLASGKYRFVKNSAKTAVRKTRRKSSSVKRRTKRVISKIKSRRSMARRRRSYSRKSKSSGLTGTIKRFAKPIALGLGTASVLGIAGSAIGQPALAQNKLLNAGAAFVLGGPVAGGAALLLGGGGSLFGNGHSNGEGLA